MLTLDDPNFGIGLLFMTVKRLILALLTVLAVVQMSLSLLESWNQPQIQSRLELYQTNLLLHAAEWQDSDRPLSHALIGKQPLEAAEKQYTEVRQTAEKTQQKLQSELAAISVIPQGQRSEGKELQATIVQLDRLITELDLRLGILQIQQGQKDTGLKTWQDLIARTASQPQLSQLSQLAALLSDLWNQQLELSTEIPKQLQTNLDGWFRYQALSKFYSGAKDREQLLALQAQEQEIAFQSVWKLALVGGIPALGLLIGVGIILVLVVQWLWQRFRHPESANLSPLFQNAGIPWETPWDGETIVQVIVVGFFFIFFFVGSILLPIVFNSLDLHPTSFDSRMRATYALSSYSLVAVGGFSVLYLSLKPFFPLPANWFKFKLVDNWFVWGLGGYFVALPLVIIVSVINQGLWQGQGGSNPILPIALENRDGWAMAIFFLTASIAAPIFEEVIFRGFLLPSLTKYLPVWGAIAASSLLFAIAHLNISEVLPLATLGAVMGFIYTRSRNLLAPMFLHCLWNSGTLLSLFLLGSGAN